MQHRINLAETVPAKMLIETIEATDGETKPIVDLTHDSRQVQPDWAFACVAGEHNDGHDFAEGAVANGATTLIVERRLPLDVEQIVVEDVRIAMGPMSAAIHGMPSNKMKMIGITGTNGKTTTTHLLGSILRAAGFEEREIGTLSGKRTTPEAPDLQRRLAGFVAEGVDAVSMEVSSHALALHRTAGTHFDVAVFTNLGRDHLDLHESMESYFRAKASLFTTGLSDVGVANIDDPYGRLLLDVANIEMIGFSADDAQDLEVGVASHSFSWRGTAVHVPVGGRFNFMNSLAALNAAEALGISPQVAASGLAGCSPVPGRFELVTNPDHHSFSVIVDYAHTPDGLVEVLAAARQLAMSGRVLVVFGCGGDRDIEKRPIMGAAAAAGADVVVVTSDNPRHEEPQTIIDHTIAGIAPADMERVKTDVDRRAAMATSLQLARPGDVVVVAGKGHETTQTIGDVANPFDDRVVARELLAELPTGGTKS